MWSVLSGNGSYLILSNDFWGACKLSGSDYYNSDYSQLSDVFVHVNRPSVKPELRGKRVHVSKHTWACSGVRSSAHLQFLCALVVQRLQWEVEVVVVCQLAQIKVILGINAGRHVDVKLQKLQEVALHLIPAGGKNIWAWSHTAVHERKDGWMERDSSLC